MTMSDVCNLLMTLVALYAVVLAFMAMDARARGLPRVDDVRLRDVVLKWRIRLAR